ncbi:MAG: glucosaminidase domain-containing protein [Steroidobacteraceae bacterium]
MAGTKTTSPNSWEGVLAAAQSAGAKFPELVAAQWALESGWGKHTSGQNNYFGLKGEGAKRQTTEYVGGKSVEVTAEFLEFADLGACVQYLVTRWYKDWGKYEGVNRAASREAAAKELVKQSYATDPAYADKLIKLMDEKAPRSEAVKASAPVKAKPKPILFRIVARQDTWLKKNAVQATELGESAKVAVPRGKSYAVCAYTEVAGDGHAQVQLAAGSGTWFVFEPHWQRDQASGVAVPSSVDWSDFGCQVTPNLTVGEILQWDKRRIPPANSAVRTRLLRTAQEFQRIREAWGRPLGVTSFYRPEPINAQVGGVPGSKHVLGEAMDLYPVDRSLESFYQWIRGRWTGGLGDGRARGFVHLDLNGKSGAFVPGAGVRPAREWNY